MHCVYIFLKQQQRTLKTQYTCSKQFMWIFTDNQNCTIPIHGWESSPRRCHEKLHKVSWQGREADLARRVGAVAKPRSFHRDHRRLHTHRSYLVLAFPCFVRKGSRMNFTDMETGANSGSIIYDNGDTVNNSDINKGSSKYKNVFLDSRINEMMDDFYDFMLYLLDSGCMLVAACFRRLARAWGIGSRWKCFRRSIGVAMVSHGVYLWKNKFCRSLELKDIWDEKRIQESARWNHWCLQ